MGAPSMWRFIHLSDPHLASERDGVWNHGFLCTMMPEVMAVLAKDFQAIDADFILATGDIVSKQTREAMFEARDLMESLGKPYYPMGGNHDFVKPESRKWFLEAFAHRLPRPETFYSFTHENLHFCVLDAWWLWSDGSLCPISEASVAAKLDVSLSGARWALPPEQLAWLREDLARNKGKHTMIAVHYPAIPIPLRMQRNGLRNGGCLENGDLLLEILADFPQVKAIFSGHVHLHFIEQAGGITQVTTGALPEFPTEYRIVEVHDDRLEISTHGLSDPQFAARSRNDALAFTAGDEKDRKTTIFLTDRG